MASEVTYAEVRFKNESNTSSASSEPSAAPKEKTSPQQSNPGFPKQLLASLLIFLLLLAISSFIAFIIFFQRCYQLPKEKKNSNDVFHEKLTCEKTNLTVEGKGWGCCPENWIASNTSCYFISFKLSNWTESEKNCAGVGAHLLVINTKEEQLLIYQKLDKRFAYYMGLSDPERTYQWQWVDQSPYDKSVTFWHPGEPSDNNEHCVFINSVKANWGWNNAPCHESQNSVCEMMKIYL
ncbi:C-type lectin domain family 4 member A-like isoform X1 [Loxodonta africana]|uniref:C-type lectin domain family 4 member A-like isoform X1 n=2 Tax=Loxodonta africana TaxID=9785 RepID=UPI000C812580|nr:C-type lectin domain family 4 member A-like isoform X1 [Loxodonta africana]XP_023404842.1 C-type lectin domain family 4 member A-like isoform X1 [Loxodonta africana]XP_023404843.1 C-type lectin domain family 4 member A-like isoform X1 [Loxodonta africana]